MARNDHLPPPRRRQLFWLRRPFRGELPRDPRRPGNRPGDSPAGVAGRPRGITRRIRREISPGYTAGEFPAISDARPGNPRSYSLGAHRKSREIHRGGPRGWGVAGPRKRTSRGDFAGNTPPTSPDLFRGDGVFRIARGVRRETQIPGHLQNNMISATLPGEGAASVPPSAELPGQ